ncbi:unnamed protein product, partial [Closterium sp. NIES-54]
GCSTSRAALPRPALPVAPPFATRASPFCSPPRRPLQPARRPLQPARRIAATCSPAGQRPATRTALLRAALLLAPPGCCLPCCAQPAGQRPPAHATLLLPALLCAALLADALLPARRPVGNRTALPFLARSSCAL